MKFNATSRYSTYLHLYDITVSKPPFINYLSLHHLPRHLSVRVHSWDPRFISAGAIVR